MITKDRSCEGKRFYDTEWEATQMASVQRDASGHDNINEYKCLYCAGWHIGHSFEKFTKRESERCQVCEAMLYKQSYRSHCRKAHPKEYAKYFGGKK